jgi:Gram-negative bacterial TonB protein C-terminal
VHDSRKFLLLALAVSIAFHVMLGLAWSAFRLHAIISNSPESQLTKPFRLVKTNTQEGQTSRPVASEPKHVPPVLVQSSGSALPSIRIPPLLPRLEAAREPPEKMIEATDEFVPIKPPGPFVSPIDPKQAWINVAESVNYGLLDGFKMDVSQGEYRLSTELDVRVRARGDLLLEYPLMAAAIGKESVIYVILQIDENGNRTRTEIVRGDADFDRTVIDALDMVQFLPGKIRERPVKSILILEFAFRRSPPEIGGL